MSESIIIKGVSSYHPTTPEFIDISKQNTLIFGLNGTGKSTISNFLYAQEKFKSCSINVEGSFTPIVYNQAFIEQNFVKSSEQEGVFTLSKDNADLEARITEKAQLRDKLAVVYNGIKAKISEAEKAKIKATDSAVDEIFKQKHIIEETSLNPFLEGFKRPKSRFYNQVKSQEGVSNDSIESLQAEYDSLTQFDKTLPTLIILPPPPSLIIENETILSEPIVGSKSSQLTEFISEINSLNWVKHGKDNYLSEAQTKCPFCQNETIDDAFHSELEALFDKTYVSNVQKVEEISKSYSDAITNYIASIKNTFINCSFYDPSLHNIAPAIDLLERVYQDNLNLIKLKSQAYLLNLLIIKKNYCIWMVCLKKLMKALK